MIGFVIAIALMLADPIHGGRAARPAVLIARPYTKHLPISRERAGATGMMFTVPCAAVNGFSRLIRP